METNVEIVKNLLYEDISSDKRSDCIDTLETNTMITSKVLNDCRKNNKKCIRSIPHMYVK